MDISKLPKLSKTDAPPPPAQPEVSADKPVAAPQNYGRAPQEPATFAESWIGFAVGVILLLMFPTMIKYISSRLFGTFFAPFENSDGTQVPYPKVYPQFWSDLCTTLFAIVLIVEGLVLAFFRKKWVIAAALVLTGITTVLNVWYVMATFSNYGAPIVSLFAVVFGIFICTYEWQLLRR